MAELTINNFSQGVAQSPLVGFGDMRNCNILDTPGVIKLNNPLSKKSVSVVTGLIKWFVKNPLVPTQVWGLDENGVVYKSTDSGDTWAVLAGNTAGGKGQGLQIWKDYLFVAYTTGLDVYGPLTAGSGWSLAWKTIDSDALWHPLLISKLDNKLYGGAGKYVFSLDENTGQTFAPGTGATYTWTQQALDLPPNYRIKSLAEQGNNLMCGTWMGTNVYDFKIADIFPWDRSSPSFMDPIQVNENCISSLLNIGGIVYMQAGIDGKLQTSNGVSSSLIGQIPQSIADLSGGKYLEPMPGALINHKGRPFFGISGTNISGMGVWSLYQTSKGNILNLENIISTGNDGTSAALKIGSLLEISRDVILVAWQDGVSTFGVDKINTSAVNTGYTGYFLTPFYIIGSSLQPRKFLECEFQLIRPLRTGEGIKLEYRTDLTASFTTVIVWDYSTLGSVLSHNTILGQNAIPQAKGAEQIQLKISLTGTTTSPNLRSIILR